MAKRHPSLIPLSHDHHHALALALRCRKHALGQLNPADRQSLEDFAQEVRQFGSSALIPHFKAEENVLFPVLAGHPECRSLIGQLESEHRELGAKLSREADPVERRKFLFDFGDLLERHVRLEERELFPRFEELIPEAEAARVGQEIKRALEAAQRTGDGAQ